MKYLLKTKEQEIMRHYYSMVMRLLDCKKKWIDANITLEEA